MNESGNPEEGKAQSAEEPAAFQGTQQHADKPVETMKTPESSSSQESQNLSQPEFGQRRKLDYGAMKNQFPADYNPYVFGRPEPDKSRNDQQDNKQQRGFTARFPFNGPRGDGDRSAAPQSGGFNGQPNQYGTDGQMQRGPSSGGTGYSRQNGFYGAQGQNQQTADGHVPDVQGGIDMNDPNQNPLWGRWSAMAIFAFVMSLIGMPYLGLILGVISIRRTKMYHMRGRGLSVAAVVIGILLVLVNLWFMAHPGMFQDMINQMYDMAGGAGSLDASGVFGV